MSSATLVRFALLSGAAMVAASGCGSNASAPRLLELPAHVRPIGAASESNFPREETLSAPAQYEQPQESAGAARITEVSSAQDASGGRSIREPAAGAMQEPTEQPAKPPRRSEFVPIAMPATSALRLGRPAPQMPPANDFSSLASEPRPEGPGWAGPSVPSPENAGRVWKPKDRPAEPAQPVEQVGMERERGRASIATAPTAYGGWLGEIDSRPQATQASQPVNRPIEGPLLIKADGPGWAGASVPSPDNAGREWSVAVQPAEPAAAVGQLAAERERGREWDFAAQPTEPAAAVGQREIERERGRESIAIAPTVNGQGFGAIESRPRDSAPQFEQQGPTAAMQVVSQRAMQMAEQATVMANRGMLYSAQTELLQSLAMIAQALDVQTATNRHATAFNAGITALSEAREFASTTIRPGEAVNIGPIAAGHRTPVLRGNTSAELSPVVAQQQYFGYAQNQLTLALGNVPAGSQILYRLGRLQTAMAAHDADPQAMREPQAIVYHQAALATDRGNWLAANELGVLYARYGQLAEARQLLIHSVAVHSNLEAWHNLSIVHRRLGEADLAQKAQAEWQSLAKQTGKTRSDASEMVRWVDPQTFAASNATDTRWPASTAGRPVAAAQASVRR